MAPSWHVPLPVLMGPLKAPAAMIVAGACFSRSAAD
jgi:hypothetical protein